MKRIRMAAIAALAIFSLALAGCQDTGSSDSSLDIPVSIPASMDDGLSSPSTAP